MLMVSFPHWQDLFGNTDSSINETTEYSDADTKTKIFKYILIILNIGV